MSAHSVGRGRVTTVSPRRASTCRHAPSTTNRARTRPGVRLGLPPPAEGRTHRPAPPRRTPRGRGRRDDAQRGGCSRPASRRRTTCRRPTSRPSSCDLRSCAPSANGRGLRRTSTSSSRVPADRPSRLRHGRYPEPSPRVRRDPRSPRVLPAEGGRVLRRRGARARPTTAGSTAGGSTRGWWARSRADPGPRAGSRSPFRRSWATRRTGRSWCRPAPSAGRGRARR